MIKKSSHLLIIVLFLGLVFDFLFYRQYLGVNYAIFVAICLVCGFYILISNGLRPALNSLWLLIPLIFFTAMTFIRKEPLTLFLAVVFSLLSISLLVVTYRGGRWMQYNLLDYIEKYFYLGLSLIARPITYYMQIQKERPEQPKEKKFPIMPILRGVLIAIPVVLFFTALLSSADVVFNQKLLDIFDQITLRTFFENLYRLFIIVFWAYLLAGLFLHAAAKSQDEKLGHDKKPVVKPFLGFTEAAIVLGSVIVLFTVFVVIQFQYFFGGQV